MNYRVVPRIEKMCFSLLLLVFLCSKLHAQVNQKSLVKNEQLASDFGSKWIVFNASLKGLAAEERILKVEEWKSKNEKALRAASLLIKERLMAQPAAAPELSSAAPLAANQFMADAYQINRKISSDFDNIRKESLTSEQRIEKVDAFLVQHKDDLTAQREKIALSTNQIAAAAASLGEPTKSPQSPDEILVGQFSAEVQGMVDATKSLSAEDRISAIDKAMPRIQALEKQISAAKKTTSNLDDQNSQR